LERENGMTWLVRAEDRAERNETGKRMARSQRTAVPAETEIVFKRLMPLDALRIRGLHNAANALAALALCQALDLPLAQLLHGLREYRGEPHRVETIAVLDGVDYVDDSKGTNVGATVAALDGLAQRCVLIAGGDGKGQDFAPLAAPVQRWCRTVLLIGRDAPLLHAALQTSDIPIETCATLEAAVQRAAQLAESGEVVLLSPACASFDMFRNYAHRAAVFKQSVEQLAAERGSVL
jgi:UDP-N-acetylmuramoylalanine--D-glutamate ligase